jgi:phosphoglucomutase
VNFGAVTFPDNGQTVSFLGDALNQASVDSILAIAVASGVTTIIIDLTGGTNSSPSAAGLIDKATLNGLGNTVTTN